MRRAVRSATCDVIAARLTGTSHEAAEQRAGAVAPERRGGRCAREPAADTVRHDDRLQPRVRVREAALERLAAAEKSVLPHAVAGRLADRVRQQDEADGRVAVREVATRLVVRLDASEAEPVPGRRGTPAALERDARELDMELAPAQERRPVAPPGRVEGEEEREVVVEPRRVVRQPERQGMSARESPLPSANLLAEVGAASGEVRLPTVERERRARLPADYLAAELGAPGMPSGQQLREQRLDPRPDGGLGEGACGGAAVGGRADGSELVGRPVPEEARDAHGSRRRQVEREDRHEPASRVAAYVQDERPVVPVQPPPGRGPLPRREDVPGRLGQGGPLVAKRVERGGRFDEHRLGARRVSAGAHRRSAAATRDASGTRRASRRPCIATAHAAAPAGDGAKAWNPTYWRNVDVQRSFHGSSSPSSSYVARPVDTARATIA